MQINRLLEIVYILLGEKAVTAGELSRRFGVSQRTIYRDLDVLSLAGIPIYTDRGKGGGIRVLPEYVLNKSFLSEKEQNEILTALQALSIVRDIDIDMVRQKLSALFNKSMVNWLQVDFSDWSFSGADYFNQFKSAILERRIAEFDYYNSRGEKLHRSVEPVQLIFKQKAWYASCFCLKRREMRLFKLTRIKNLLITKKHFQERRQIPNFVENFWADEHKQKIELKLKIDPQMAFLVFDDFGEENLEKQPDGGFIVSACLPEDEWIYGFILSFGEYIEVLEPAHMRKTVREMAEKITKKYL